MRKVCVCVLPSQNWQVPRAVLIRKQEMRMVVMVGTYHVTGAVPDALVHFLI